MKTLYLDCGMGAAGDMLTAALLELTDNKDAFTEKLNSLGIPGVRYIAEKSEKCGICGIHVTVKVNGEEESEGMHSHHHHHHTGPEGIEHIVNGHINVSEKVKNDILAVYGIIAEAESRVHGVGIHEIHFHEVGTMDAVADVTAVCLLMDELGFGNVVVSPVNTGSGTVKCAHGILPVPAPATAEILKGMPAYSSGIMSELCTPTGAALLKYFASSFGSMPVMNIEKTGYGMGKKDFETANCVRAIMGETAEKEESITELVCNLDDMTGEEIGHACEVLLAEGAADVYTEPITMKKSRPAVKLCVLCRESEKAKMVRLIFAHTSTIGIRENVMKRYTLDRSIEERKTALGTVRVKRSEGYGIIKEKYEYDDIARIADANGKSIEETLKNL